MMNSLWGRKNGMLSARLHLIAKDFIHLVCGNNEAEKAAMFQEAAVRWAEKTRKTASIQRGNPTMAVTDVAEWMPQLKMLVDFLILQKFYLKIKIMLRLYLLAILAIEAGKTSILIGEISLVTDETLLKMLKEYQIHQKTKMWNLIDYILQELWSFKISKGCLTLILPSSNQLTSEQIGFLISRLFG